MQSIFNIELDTSEYNILAVNDTIRMLVIQVVVQILFTLRNPSVEFLSLTFVENTLFILLGVIIYWLVFNHLVHIKPVKGDKDTLNNYYQSVYLQ